MNTQETKAVEDAAKTKTNEYCVSSDEVLSLKRSVIHDYLLSLFIAGAQFLDELRKPSERPNVKDYFAATETLGAIHNEIVKAPRLYAYMQALDAYIDNLEEKPIEPETNVGEAGKELVSEIDDVLMQPNKELLEAAKDALRTFYGIGCNEEAEIVQVLTKAILNYEKQSK
jgi:hypothetical protein